MELFYTPPHARVGDVIPFYDNGVFCPFYLKNWNSYDAEDRQHGWHMLKTSDHIHFSEKATGIRGGTGCVLHLGDVYHLFYCVFEQKPQRQYICHAISHDGMATWEKLPDETFGPDETHYMLTDWRDPFIFWNAEESCWWMLTCALSKTPTTRRGCVGLCTSKDLTHWDVQPPLYAPGASMGAYECPDLFEMNGWYYLVFSQFTDHFRTVYRMSRSLRGPWITLPVDSFDGRAFYAAKTGTDGARRLLYGWAPTRIGNGWKFNPEDYPGFDYNTYDWGGSMVVHEIVQRIDGTLGVKPLDSVNDALTVQNHLKWEAQTGEWQLAQGSAQVTTPGAYAALLSWNDVPSLCQFSFDFTFEAGTETIGLALQVDEKFAKGYYFYFEPARQRVQYKSAIRMHEQGGWTFPYEVELERPMKLVPGHKHHVTVFVQDSLMVMYADDVALCARGYDWHDRKFGLAVSDGAAAFTGLTLKTFAHGEAE